jgi:hypothetical protein
MSTDRKSDHRVIVYVEADLLELLRSEHERARLPVSEIVRRALRQYLKPTGFEVEMRLAEEAGEIPHD